MLDPVLVLWCFPVATLIIFSRLPPARATIVAFLAGYLFLPEGSGIIVPGLPFFGKTSVISMVVALAVLVNLQKATTRHPGMILDSWFPKSAVVLGLMGAVILGTFGTVMTNGDTLVFGPLSIRGLRLSDTPSFLVDAITLLLPLFLARRILGHPDTHVWLLAALVTGGLIYSAFAIYEARMSPQLHRTLYGYFQHDWKQHVRDGGFRPIVFLEHGLWVSLFFSTTILAALALFRSSAGTAKTYYLAAAVWLLVTLVVTKSLGALIIVIVLGPLLFLGTVRLKLLIAAGIAALVLAYPALRGAGMVPIDRITSIATSINPARASSLGARLKNEDALLSKIEQKPVFGWGSWGRNRIYSSQGENLTVTDGFWVILISTNGWVGYVGIFGLLSFGIIGLAFQVRNYEVSLPTAGIAIALAGNMIDLIPNAGLTPITFLFAGALIGRLEHGRITSGDDAPVPEAPPVGYTRFAPSVQRPAPTPPDRATLQRTTQTARYAR